MLVQLSLFTRIPIQSTINHIVDSKVLIRRIEQAISTTYDNPSATLKAEADVTREIGVTIQQFPHKPKYTWVKGHQDEHKPYDKLEYAAQINCDADALASSYYQQMQRPITREPPLLSTPARLLIADLSTTSKYKSKIRRAYTIPALRAYVCHRFCWEDNILDHISWDVFTQIIKHFYQNHITIVKHTHAIAPTGHIAH